MIVWFESVVKHIRCQNALNVERERQTDKFSDHSLSPIELGPDGGEHSHHFARRVH